MHVRHARVHKNIRYKYKSYAFDDFLASDYIFKQVKNTFILKRIIIDITRVCHLSSHYSFIVERKLALDDIYNTNNGWSDSSKN